MSRRIGPLARAEDGADVVRASRGDVEKRLVAGDLVMGHGRLEQMPHAILLVHVFFVRPSLLGLPLGQGVERVQIAVLPLGGGHHRDQLVQVQPHHGLGMDLERIRGAFHDLVKVGIVEIDALVLALPDAGGLLEVADPARLFALLETVRDRHEPAGREAGRPEAVLDVHLVERHRRDVVIPLQPGLLLLCRAEARPESVHENEC